MDLKKSLLIEKNRHTAISPEPCQIQHIFHFTGLFLPFQIGIHQVFQYINWFPKSEEDAENRADQFPGRRI